MSDKNPPRRPGPKKPSNRKSGFGDERNSAKSTDKPRGGKPLWGDKARAKAASKSGENAGSSRAPWEKTPTERRDKPVPAQSKPYAGKSENARPARAGARPAPAPARAAAASGRGKPAEAAPPPPAPPAPHIDGKQERIAKLLARAGVASRREIERMIEDRRIALDGVVLETPATILTSLRGVTVDGQPVAAPERTRLFRFHKPSGLLTAERDPAGRPTIYTALRNALPQGAPRLMPIGRLDLNTEGLLLMTNDGELKRLLELPATGVPRTYRARTFGDISQAQLEELIHGITIEGVHYGRIDANLERRTGRNQWIELTLTEGKNREVRRVLEHLGLAVSRLMRTYYGPFMLEDLPRGAAVEVHPEDVARFRNSLRPPRSRAGDTTAKNDTNDKEA